MRVVAWSDAAQQDLDQIADYIGQDNPHAARRVGARITESAAKLAFMPTARAGRVAGTFEKPVKGLPYTIAFELVSKDQLHVLRVIHGARDWPQGGWPEDAAD